MNILPHKSWHVRTKKNIERVRKDEEKAAEEEKEKQRKIALAEQEARTDLLRSRTKNKSLTDASPLSVSDDKHRPAVSQDLFPEAFGEKDIAIPGLGDTREHMNFFKDIEDGVVKQGKNKEHEEEKKKEQEELEKKIGLLTYLGQSSLGGQESAPWYLQKTKKQSRKKHKDDSNSENEEDREKKLKLAMEKKRKQFMDPLLQMKEFLDKNKHKHNKKKDSSKDRKVGVNDRSKSSVQRSSSSKSSVQTSSYSSSSTKKTIEQLRAERLAREREEHARTQALLGQSARETKGVKRAEKNSSSEDEIEERKGVKRKYNSQYNPEFVRQPKSRRTEDFH